MSMYCVKQDNVTSCLQWLATRLLDSHLEYKYDNIIDRDIASYKADKINSLASCFWSNHPSKIATKI